jgi:hypothetical protein
MVPRLVPLTFAVLLAGALMRAQAPQSASKWTGGRAPTSEMDSSPSVMYLLDADRPIQGWPNKKSTPTLVLRCKEGTLDAFVQTRMSPNPSADAEEYRQTLSEIRGTPVGPIAVVRVRWDATEAGDEYWGVATDRETLFASEPYKFVEAVVKTQALRIQFTPYRSNPQIMLFSVRGFGSARVDALLKNCPKSR